MKLGFGLYKHMLNKKHYDFAKQCGATHLIVHLTDYFGKEHSTGKTASQPVGENGWAKTSVSNPLWSVDDLIALKKDIEAQGLKLEAIENFDPAHWYDILLDGSKKANQMANIKQLIRNVGKAGIPIFGYNFSLAGVSSRITGDYARGQAISVGMDGVDDTPIPNGMVWNMVYDDNAPGGTIPKINHEELWDRLKYFLDEIIPVAEESGVTMAAHPDDPPVPNLRNTPRLVYQPNLYQKLIDMKPSQSNKLEYCLGSISEMTEGNIYEYTDIYSRQNKIAYLHFRNVIGKVPYYKEVFVDEGDINMVKILEILKKNDYHGVIIPDHTPQMTCDAPWYAGMAYAMGYMKAAMSIVNKET